jgi:hypothetical protein
MNLLSLRWATRLVNGDTMTSLSSCSTINISKVKLNVCFRVFFLNLILYLLLKTHSTIANQNIINLFKVKVYVIMMVSVLPLMLLFLFHFFLPHIELLFNMLREIRVALCLILRLLISFMVVTVSYSCV